MLSILIPVYNCSVVKLVKELHDQCMRAKILFEILVFDDGSRPKYKEENQKLNRLFCVNYVELSTNHGRSKIRNRMAKTASLKYLLFLDSDSKISSRKFIKKYVAVAKENCLISGGRIYSKKAPRSKKKYLHWLYGTKMESQSVKVRNLHPSRYFHTNNFLVSKDIMIKYPFDEEIKGYGYEDILFAHALQEDGIEIIHIDNPIIHGILEPLDTFLKKQDEALLNLKRLIQLHPEIPVRLWLKYRQLESYGLNSIIYKILGPSNKRRKKLLNSKPSLSKLRNYRYCKFYELIESIKLDGSD